MEFPKLNIYTDKIAHNAKIICDRCAGQGISVVAVTKSVLADPVITAAITSSKIETLGDSRLKNLKLLKKNFNHYRLMQLRSPMLSEAEQTAEICDVSACTQIEVARAINKVCRKKNITHSIMVMLDTDDLREGLLPSQVLPFCRKVFRLSHVNIASLGTNARCISSKKPTYNSLFVLSTLQREIRASTGKHIPVLSGGNSSLLKQVFSGQIPEEINQLRIGEAILLGHETVGYNKIEGAYNDSFCLEAEIIEVKRSGNKAILALGAQDADADNLCPVDDSIKVVGQSSDHTVIQPINGRKLAMGGKISFNINYYSLLSIMTSPFVYKNYIGRQY
ncbi:MAG: alanine racemase [Actinomycetia bacterium]|nr:alanine racemase [Actinomycetes bacterium]